MKRNIILTLLIIIIAVVFFLAGAGWKRVSVQPVKEKVYIGRVIWKDPPAPEVEIKEVPGPEVIIELPCPPHREFKDTREAMAFLRSLELEQLVQPNWDCDDPAYYFWTKAIDAGYYTSFQVDKLNGQNHALNSIIIGNNIYFIEPLQLKMWLKAVQD